MNCNICYFRRVSNKMKGILQSGLSLRLLTRKFELRGGNGKRYLWMSVRLIEKFNPIFDERKFIIIIKLNANGNAEAVANNVQN